MSLPGDGRGLDPIIVLRGVVKFYPGTVALEPLSLTIGRGERVAVLGPSGSGKTTVLHLIGGVIRPDEGSIAIDGTDLARTSPGAELAGMVGVMHQQLDLVPHLAVVSNVLAGRLGSWSLWRSLVSLVAPRERELAESALERVGIADKLHERTSRLSGGEQQRVALARLLVQQPRVIVADEPVAALDPARAADLMGLLASIVAESGKTLVASVHSIELGRRYFTRAIGLRGGALKFDLPISDLTDEVLDGLYYLGVARGEV